MNTNNRQEMPETNSPTILIVEDSRPQALKTKLNLESNGCLVELVETGAEALAIVRQRHFDLIVLDVELPDTNGFEVCKKLKADSQLINIPVVMLTSRDQADDAVNGLAAGADDYIPKDAFADMVLVETIKAIPRN